MVSCIAFFFWSLCIFIVGYILFAWLLNVQSDRAKEILQAAKQGDKIAISCLLTDATAEELNYQDMVCIVQLFHFVVC